MNFHLYREDDCLKKSQPEEPLRLAIRNNHVEIARLLLEHGADANRRYFFGTQINLVTDYKFLQLLLNFGADPNSRDRSGLTPLMKVVRLPQGLEAALILLKHGADVTAMTDERHDFRTVLHYAVLSGNYKIIDLVLKQGAKLNYDEDFDLGKPSPLDLAILKGDPKIVEMLIHSGTILLQSGKIVFYVVLSGANVNFSSPIIGSPLHVACSDSVPNRCEILQVCIISVFGYVVYLWLQMLLKAGANPNLEIYKHKQHVSQLRPVLVEYLASNSNPSLAVVNLLLKYGAKLLPKTQFRDPNGVLNSLLNVIYTNRDSILLLLLQANESLDVCMLRKRSVAVLDQETILFRTVRCPLSLKRQVRLYLWKVLGGNRVMDLVESFELPKCLEKFLLFYNS